MEKKNRYAYVALFRDFSQKKNKKEIIHFLKQVIIDIEKTGGHKRYSLYEELIPKKSKINKTPTN